MKHLYVSTDPEVMSGVPCFKGTRVPIKNLFDYVSGQSSLNEFLIDFPSVPREIAVAVLLQAKQSLLADATAS